MKRLMKSSICFFITIMMMIMSSFSCFAINYTYQASVYAGSQGLFKSKDAISVVSDNNVEVTLKNESEILVKGLNVDDQIIINPSEIELKNNKYYVKGFRVGGKDNTLGSNAKDLSIVRAVQLIESDNNYVVSYGVAGDQVLYTVRYLDQEGNSLREAATFYGTKNEFTVVGYQYIDGYLPQAYNLGKTLSENEAENVFDFIYTGQITTTIVEGETVSQTTDGQGGVINPTTTPVAGGAGAGTGATVDQETTPEEFENLDDEQTPLAGANQKKDDASSFMNNPLAIIGTSLGILLLLILFIMVKRRKKQINE